jgi:hypothetical protein
MTTPTAARPAGRAAAQVALAQERLEALLQDAAAHDMPYAEFLVSRVSQFYPARKTGRPLTRTLTVASRYWRQRATGSERLTTDLGVSSAGWLVDDKVSPTPQLRQGDLIAFQSDESLRRYGLVVTADCDLLQRKHARLVTLVPVVELLDIVEYYLLPEMCDRYRQQITDFAVRALGVQTSLDLPEGMEELRVRAEAASGDPADC